MGTIFSPRTFLGLDLMLFKANIIYRLIYCLFAFCNFAFSLFPLDGSGRFGGNIEYDPVDPFYVIDDFTAYFSQEIIRQSAPFSRHAIGGTHGAQRDGLFVGALVAHHTNRVDG